MTGADLLATIVAATRQNGVSGANTSQLARSLKWKKEKYLPGNSKVSERRISV